MSMLKDRFLGVDKALELNAFSWETGIPIGGITMTKEGIIVPTRPMAKFEGKFYTKPPYEKAGRPETLRKYWEMLQRGVNNLVDFHTGFDLTYCIRESAVDVFAAGSVIAKELPDSQLVLPPNLGFSPKLTVPYKHTNNGSVFNYSAWIPGLTEQGETIDSHGFICSSVFFMTLKGPQRENIFRISVNDRDIARFM